MTAGGALIDLVITAIEEIELKLVELRRVVLLGAMTGSTAERKDEAGDDRSHTVTD